MIIDEALPSGEAANTAAVLGITLGGKVPGVIGAEVGDGAGNSHAGVIRIPVPILKASRDEIGKLRLRLYKEFADLTAIDFTDLAQSCRSYDEFIDKMSYTSELSYIGLALYGDKQKISKLTGNLPLLR
ncbi:MAG: DUF2000 domain-containing protein [Oscillospiraceae bacterium]|nr:DUF2000 domain-containing protein [Oscillospiraceae bacterium]